LTPFARLEPAAFGFALYTSDEYMTKLAYGLEEAQE
jgi:hypothetical protein